MSRIFISYRRVDSEGYVGRLYDHLVQHFDPQDIFMDVVSIEPGADFIQELEEAVAACDICIVMIGPQWLTTADDSGERRIDQWNDFVRIEIASALKQNKLVIPALVGGAKMPNPKDLPEDLQALARRNAIELSHQRFGYDAGQLITTIKVSSPAKTAIRTRSTSEVIQQKAEALKAVWADLVGATHSPLYNYRNDNRHFPVIGAGNPDANILFIGESPGRVEAAQGVPFVGPSGEVLDEMLRSINLKRDDVFMTNILLDHPPASRDPQPEELEFYTPFLDRIIDIIQPAVIVPLGRFAMGYMLKKLDLPEKKGKISQLHGKLIKAQLPYGEIHIVPMFHPAVVLYTASQKDVLKKDFEKLKLFI